MILILVFLAALTACEAASLPTQLPDEPLVQTESSESLPETSTTSTSVPTAPAEEATMTAVSPPDAAAEKMVELVKAHLAQSLGVTAGQITLSSVKPAVWRDAGLGCPKPNIDYVRMETPGYTISLEAGGKTYTYHTDETKRFVQCRK
jgi:hypothetical protein